MVEDRSTERVFRVKFWGGCSDPCQGLARNHGGQNQFHLYIVISFCIQYQCESVLYWTLLVSRITLEGCVLLGARCRRLAAASIEVTILTRTFCAHDFGYSFTWLIIKPTGRTSRCAYLWRYLPIRLFARFKGGEPSSQTIVPSFVHFTAFMTLTASWQSCS